jgi:SNF2 family DNA or RNA helicase
MSTTDAAPALMPHQEEGVAFLLDRGSGLLAFEQGLGKTLVAIEAFRRLRASGGAEQMLVVCPNHLKRNWLAELTKFAPTLSWTIVEGTAAARRRAFAMATTDVVITSYETARTEVTGVMALLKRRHAVMVLDECHAVKNLQTLTSTAAQHFAPLAVARWLLSGTPVTNSATDLYAQIGIVSAGRPLGSFESFTDTFTRSPSPGANEELVRRIAPFVLRRTKDACLDLPAKNFVDIVVELPAWQRQMYNRMRDDLVVEVRAMTGAQFRAFAPTALTRLLRLAQLASNPELVLPSTGRTAGKFVELDALIDEVVRTNGHKVILWSNYVKTIQTLSERYADVGVVTLFGGTPGELRQVNANRFQADNDVRLLIGNPAAAGTGFTLTAASYSIYETLSWRYDFYAQSQDRNHRIGQSQPVTYLRLIAADTIDEVIIAALERKGALARSLLGDPAASSVVAQLSQRDFCSMLMDNSLPPTTQDD